MNNIQWLDWVGVGVIVWVAAVWLGIHFYRKWKRRKACAEAGVNACDSGCDGCRFSKGCCIKPPPSK